MLYQNTLLQTFNNEYDKLLVKQELLRKEIATMIYGFYTNNKPLINYYVRKYMLDSSIADLRIYDSRTKSVIEIDGSNQLGMFTEKTINIMPKIHYDLVGKVTDLRCTIYNAGADRYLLNENNEVNDKETDKLMEIYNGVNFPKVINQIYKQGWLFNCILVQPVWRNEKIEIDIITPNFCSVTTNDNDLNLKEVFIAKSVNNEDVTVYWSDTEHYYIDATNNKTSVPGNDGNKNIYGELPFAVLRFQDSSDFWGEPQQDLVENNIWYNVREMNNYFVEMFQGLGVGLGINLSKSGTISLSPNTMITVDGVTAEMQTPSINFSSTNAPLSELRESLESHYKRIGNSKGLSSQSMSNEVDVQSGVSKAFDSAELQIKKDGDKIVMKAFEKELYDKIKLVYNYHSEQKISDKVIFKIDIIEDEPQINVSEEIAITEFRLQNNMISVLDLMIKDNPDLTIEEAKLRLEENKMYNEKYLTNNNEKQSEKGNTDSNSSGSNGGDDSRAEAD